MMLSWHWMKTKFLFCYFLTYPAAFDTTDNDSFLSRLDSSFGIHNTVLSWFSSNLSERFVTVQDHQSPTTTMGFRVPQRSVLGLALFILYTTLLSHLIEKHRSSSGHSLHHDTITPHCHLRSFMIY